MNSNAFDQIGKKLPYAPPPQGFAAVRERLSGRLDAHAALQNAAATRSPVRPQRTTVRRMSLALTAAVVLLGTAVLLFEERQRPESPSDLEELIATAPAETVRQAAAECYDEILFNQQL